MPRQRKWRISVSHIDVTKLCSPGSAAATKIHVIARDVDGQLLEDNAPVPSSFEETITDFPIFLSPDEINHARDLVGLVAQKITDALNSIEEFTQERTLKTE